MCSGSSALGGCAVRLYRLLAPRVPYARKNLYRREAPRPTYHTRAIDLTIAALKAHPEIGRHFRAYNRARLTALIQKRLPR